MMTYSACKKSLAILDWNFSVLLLTTVNYIGF